MNKFILAPDEREVHFSQCAAEPDVWIVYSDDSKWQRRLERKGAVLLRVMSDGLGREYSLHANQLRIFTRKTELSAVEKAQRGERLRASRKTA